LHASQEVDIDEETIEDILDVLTAEEESRTEAQPPDSHSGLMDDDGPQGETDDEDAEDIRALKGPETPQSLLEGQVFRQLKYICLISVTAESSWQKHEIKAMMHLLKERGPFQRVFSLCG